MIGEEEKRDTEIRSITDYELRIAFDGIGSYDRTAQSFPNLAIRLTWQDSTGKLIGSYVRPHRSRRYEIAAVYNLFELQHAESRFHT